jgi:hypothetical protein
MSDPMGFQYVVLRCVPRVDREEFVNVGVILYCQKADFLRAACHVDRERVGALSPAVDLEAVDSALRVVEAVCRGDDSAGEAGRKPLGSRFGYLTSPRSTVIQTSAVHGGVTADPTGELEHLVKTLVH